MAGAPLLVAFVLLALVLLGQGTAQATFPGENGKIAFDRDGVIRAVNPDGTDETFLTCRDEVMGTSRLQRLPADHPVWSPDGRRIAFTRYSLHGLPAYGVERENSLWVLNADGGETLLSRHGEAPAWSPDGKRLAFKSPPGLVVANRDGSERAAVPADGFYSPSWSPDGERVAFLRNRDIWVMNADGSGQVNLTEEGDQVLNSSPAWAPAGERIAFTRFNRATVRRDISAINADGSDRVQLTESPTWDSLPTWSPDGQKIAIRRSSEIWIMNADGSDATRLVPGRTRGWQAIRPGADGVSVPSQFCFSRLRRNTNRGIARLTVEVSGPGRVILRQRPGVKRLPRPTARPARAGSCCGSAPAVAPARGSTTGRTAFPSAPRSPTGPGRASRAPAVDGCGW